MPRRARAAIFDCAVPRAAVLMLSACTGSVAPSPSLAGLDHEGLNVLVGEIERGAFGDVRSLVLAVGDHPPMEYYFRGARRDEAVPVYSITKSITSLLAGVALESGALVSVQAPLERLLPDRAALLRADSLRAQLTVRDLLTMRAGLEWNELSTPYESAGNPVSQMLASADWVAHVLSRPMAQAPGRSYAYNSGATVVLGEAVARAMGRALADVAQERFFAPLGIARPLWHHGPHGVANAGGGLSLRPIDVLAIGRMVRDGGTRGGRAVVSRAWIAESLQPVSQAPLGARYGYQWWLLGPSGPWDPAHPVFVALGWGGQVLLLAPEHALVAVVTARNFDRVPLAAAQAWARRLHAIAVARGGS